METKLFLIDEHKETIFEGTEIEKWKSLVDELGLTKQAELIKGNNTSPLPFPAMTEAQREIYHSILDRRESYKSFSNEAIPLSILSLIALCEKEKYFDMIEIWYSRHNPDPLVVGKNYESEDARINKYTWSMIPFLIAQWGPKIKPLSELLPLYNDFKKSELKDEYEKKLNDHERSIEKFKFQIASFKES